MTGPEGNNEFCFPRISMRFEGNNNNNKIHCSPRDQSLSDLLYSKTKQKQTLKTALRFPAITCNSGQHFAGNSELFPD